MTDDDKERCARSAGSADPQSSWVTTDWILTNEFGNFTIPPRVECPNYGCPHDAGIVERKSLLRECVRVSGIYACWLCFFRIFFESPLLTGRS
jgi:hypothetical protein